MPADACCCSPHRRGTRYPTSLVLWRQSGHGNVKVPMDLDRYRLVAIIYLSGAHFAVEVRAAGGRAEVGETASAAARELARKLRTRDEVLVAGSLYVVGDVRSALGFEPS